jgi:alpha-galactosidase
MIRWLEITNRSERAVGLTTVVPFSGRLWAHRTDEHLPPCETGPKPVPPSPFELGYQHRFEWGQEGDFWFEPLPAGLRAVDGGRRGRSGWGRPAFWARNRCNGQTFVCELAWGGNCEFAVDCRIKTAPRPEAKPRPEAALFFRTGLVGHDAVLRVLTSGETVITPAVHAALFQADVSAIVQATHAHVRNVVMPPQIPGCEIEIEANHRGYLCDRENEPDLKRDAEVAAAIGAEMYVIDAGWYGNDPNRWWLNTGDWRAGSWLPRGLEPVVEHAHKLGMRFGLWVEIEAAGENSTLKREHPDWLLKRNGTPIANGRALDLTQPQVATWAEAEITRLIRQYKLDMYRIDHNHQLCPAGNREYCGYTEDLTWRYYEALYAIHDHVRAAFPGVVFQDCSGGGSRLDWGTLQHFHNAEISDWMRLPRGVKIFNGHTLSLPPEILLRTFGTECGELELDGDVDAQLRLACLGRPIFRGIAPSLEELTPYLRERIAHHLDVYREWIRPLLRAGRMFHHTPALPIMETTPWCVIEYAAEDRSRAAAMIFRTSEAGDADYVFKPRGLDRGRKYQVRFDNEGQTFEMKGCKLADGGLTVRLERPLSSQVLLFAAVDEK